MGGTESDIADAKKVPEFEGFGLGSWTVWDSFQNFKQTSAEEASTADFFTIQPTFTIKDLKKAEPFMKKCVDLTKNEKGCMYYGWTIQGDKLFCREATSTPRPSKPTSTTSCRPSARCSIRALRRWTRSSSTARRRAGRRSRRAPTRWVRSTGTATPASPSSRCELA